MIKPHTYHLKHLCLSLAIAAGCGAAFAESHNYHIDPQRGDDSFSGLSPQQPWKSFAPLSAIKLLPGDSLLLRRGEVFNDSLSLSAQGEEAHRIVVATYGSGGKPRIVAPDNSPYALLLHNSNYVTLKDLEVTNTGTSRMPGRTGVKVSCRDFGVSRGIVLSGLYIHDVNGSLVKSEGGGSGLLLDNGGKDVPSSFDGLTIEDCVIRRCERNGMIWSAYWSRDDWHPNRNVTVRRNLIEEVPGDGIVPIGCEGAVIEYNLMRDCPGTLPHSEAAAGFWPWSCDNTVMRHNEVSGHKAPWDAQGFDSDYNCTNTTIEYNYSHDNDGGLVLICNSGTSSGVGNTGTVVEYNVSINDAIRPRATRNGVFSPSIHIAGPVKNTMVRRNILHVNPKTEPFIDRSLITSDSWDGFADSTVFRDNIFFVPQESSIRLSESTRNIFDGNLYLGDIIGLPDDKNGKHSSELYMNTIRKDPEGFRSLDFLFDNVVVGDGTAVLKSVNEERIRDFFSQILQ